MSEIDIRKQGVGEVTRIRVNDAKKNGFYNVLTLSRGQDVKGFYGLIHAEDNLAGYVIGTKEEGENLIKAIQAAIELEWLK